MRPCASCEFDYEGRCNEMSGCVQFDQYIPKRRIKHIVQFSGGAASAYVAWLVAQEFGKENTILLFHDTKAEHPDAERFRKQVSEFIGVPIIEVSDGRDLWEVIKDRHCLPSFHIPFCTDDLKMKPAETFYKELDKQGIKYILYNGLGVEEISRVQRSIVRGEVVGRTVRCFAILATRKSRERFGMIGVSAYPSRIYIYRTIIASHVLRLARGIFTRFGSTTLNSLNGQYRWKN